MPQLPRSKPPDQAALVAAAEKSVARGKLRDAVEEYQRVLIHYPHDVVTMRKLSDLQSRMGEKDAAAETVVKMAKHYARDGFYLKAIAAWKLVSKLNPTLLETYESLAALYERQGLYVEAIAQLRALAEYQERHGGVDVATSLRERANAMEDAHVRRKRPATATTSGADDFGAAPRAAALPEASVPEAASDPESVLSPPAPSRAAATAPVPVVRTTNDVVVFLCHASEDKPAVRDLYARLQTDRFQPWLDEEDLLPGQNWQQEIQRAVRRSHVVLVCLSSRSVDKAGYVQKEIRFALDVLDEQPEGIIFVVPARLEECQVPTSLAHLHYADLFKPKGYERLKRALEIRAEELGFR